MPNPTRAKVKKAFLFIAVFLSAAASHAQGFSFNAVSNREITPTVPGKNDFFVVSFNNPSFSAVSGKIYDLKGHLIAGMTPYVDTTTPQCPANSISQCLMWNATSNGHIVEGGVYVYVISGAGHVYDGTVVVIR